MFSKFEGKLRRKQSILIKFIIISRTYLKNDYDLVKQSNVIIIVVDLIVVDVIIIVK